MIWNIESSSFFAKACIQVKDFTTYVTEVLINDTCLYYCWYTYFECFHLKIGAIPSHCVSKWNKTVIFKVLSLNSKKIFFVLIPTIITNIFLKTIQWSTKFCYSTTYLYPFAFWLYSPLRNKKLMMIILISNSILQGRQVVEMYLPTYLPIC